MASNFNLLHVTLQPPTAISHAVVGNFSAPASHEFAVARGGFLEVLKKDEANRVRTLHREQAFGTVRALATVRLPGHHRDILIVSSDSGRLSFLKLAPQTGGQFAFERLSCETYGKAGIRRSVPGQYLAVDPQGRAVMVASVEKDKLIFITNRDSQDQLFVSSPLDAHKSQTITFAITGLDVGFDNPVFAAIEASYSSSSSSGNGGDDDQDVDDQQAAQKSKDVVFYEVDLGLNHVVRKASRAVQPSANLLVAVPHAGVLVCSADEIEFVQPGNVNSTEPVRVAFPKRESDDPERDVLVISAATFQTDNVFFALLQTERGDVFKVSCVFDANNPSKLKELVVKYFDTIPPAVQMCISRNGLLFSASEFGNHQLFQFKSIGDSPDDASVEVSSAKAPGRGGARVEVFTPRADPLNLELFDSPKSLAPIMALRVADLAKDSGVNQIYALTGRGERSGALKVLRQGLSVMEMAALRLPKPDTRGVFTIRGEKDVDKFIVVSFAESTRVFSARTATEHHDDGEDTLRDVIEEDAKTQFARDAATLCASAWAAPAAQQMVQVTSKGFRRISSKTGEVLSEFKCPAQKKIEVAACNPRQLCIAMTGGEVVYFEADASGNVGEIAKHEMGLDVACLDCESIFLVLGCWDNSIRVLSLEKANVMAALSMQLLPDRPCSVALTRDEKKNQTRLDVGLQSGILVRSLLDLGNSGAIVDTRSHVLGSKPVRVQRVFLSLPAAEDDTKLTRESVTLCCSTRTWLCRSDASPTPVSYRAIEFACPFRSASLDGREGMVVVAKMALSIISLDEYALDPSRRLNERAVMLERTPRRLVANPIAPDLLICIEGDRDSYEPAPPSAKPAGEGDAASTSISTANNAEHAAAPQKRSADDMDVDEDDTDAAAGGGGASAQGGGTEESTNAAAATAAATITEQVRRVGLPKKKDMAWASCIRVMNPLTGRTIQKVQMKANEMAFALEQCRCNSPSLGEGYFLFVGVVDSMQLHPRSHSGCAILTYRILPSGGGRVEFLHRTKVDDVPLAFCAFDGWVACGVGSSITLYEVGQRQLLRKCEIKSLPSLVTFIRYTGRDTFMVGDAHESVFFLAYFRAENTLTVFADDVMPRMCTAGEMVDPATCMGSDKFGNVFVLRLPTGATGSDPKSRASQSRTVLWDQGNLGGAPHKLDLLAHFYVGDIVTTMQMCVLGPGRSELVLYGTVGGAIGAFVPFASRDDLDFFAHLELHLRKHFKNVLGRDHLQFRSYYAPVKSVVDGDLCETFTRLPLDVRTKIAKEMDRTVDDINKRLDEVRGSILW